MKKLFSLLTLALLTMSAWAEKTVTFDLTQGYENGTELTTLQKDGVTLTFDKGTNNNPTKWYENGASARMYGGNTLNIASSGDNITEVVFTFTGTDNTMNSTAPCSVNAGTYVEDGTTGTWTGNVQNFTITRGGTSGHARIASIEVIMGGEVVITVADPVFTPADGAMFTDSQDISLSCTTGGATIYYSTDGLAWNVYSEPFTITETTTVYAKAVLGEVESNVVTATYTKSETPTSEPIVFKSSEDQGNGSTTRAEWTVEKDGITLNCSDGTVYTDNYRIYQGATLTISSTVGNITMIEFVNTDNSRPISNLSTQTGTLTTNGAAGTWVGEAASVAFSASAQTRASEIHVYVDGGSTPIVTIAAPTFNPASQDFNESLSVEIINNEEGANIKYSTDEKVTWNDYTTPLNITETTTVYAKAVKGEKESQVVSATYTLKSAAQQVDYLEIASDLANNTEFQFTGDAVVTYQYAGYLYIKDETGYGLIFGNTNDGKNPKFAVGTMLTPGWKAKVSIFNGLHEFVSTTGLDSCGMTTVTPEIITADQMPDKVNALVQIEHVKKVEGTVATLIDGTTINLYKRFDAALPSFDNADATITGIVTVFNDSYEINFISAEGIVNAPVITPASCNFEESQVVTITAEDGAAIKYSTDEQATWNDYSAPITVTETTTVYTKAVKNGKESIVVSATYTKMEPVTYTLVTDVAELAAGDKIIFVGYHMLEDSVTVQPYAMANFKSNNFAAVAVDQVDNTITTVKANVITLESNESNWNFLTDGGYLYAAGTTDKQNYLKLESEVDAEGRADAAITITDGVPVIEFQGNNDCRFMRFNDNSADNILFSCYKESSSIKNPVYIFKAQAAGLRGDVNNDKVVNISDVTVLIDYLLNPATVINEANANVNLDEAINISDVTVLIDFLLSGTWPNK